MEERMNGSWLCHHCKWNLIPKSLMNGKGGQQVGADKKKTVGDEVGAGKKDLDSYCS